MMRADLRAFMRCFRFEATGVGSRSTASCVGRGYPLSALRGPGGTRKAVSPMSLDVVGHGGRGDGTGGGYEFFGEVDEPPA